MQQVLSSSWDGWPFGHNGHRRKLGGLCPCWDGSRVPCKTMWPGPRPTFVQSGILIHPADWPQQTWDEVWGRVPLEVELGPHLTQCCPNWGLPSYHVASWSIQPSGHNKHGLKIGVGLYPLFGKGAGSPSITVARAEAYLHAKLHLDLSNCLATIHQSYRQTGQTMVR